MTFAGTVSRQGNKPLTAATAAFSATLTGAHMVFVTIAAATVAMSGALTKTTIKILTAVMVAMAATLIRGRLFVAATVAPAASLTKQTLKGSFNAGMAAFSASLAAVHTVVVSLTASTVAMGATLTKTISKFFNAS